MPSAKVQCPYCNAKLRVQTDGGPATRAKCRICKRTFTPTYVFDAPDAGGQAVSLPAPPPDAPLEPIHWTAPPPTATVAAPPLVMPPLTEPPPAVMPPLTMPPVAAPAAAPQPVVARKLSEPPPPAVEPDEVAAGPRGGGPGGAAAGRRRREKVHDRPVNQLRPYEVALASALLLAVVGGLGFLAYQLYATPKEGLPLDSGDGERPSATAEMPVPSAVDLTIKPRPKRLYGAWDLRADDGRTGRLVLRPDGTLTASSTAGDSPLPDYDGNWYLLEEDGDRYVLEFGRERGGLDGYKVTLEVTCPDAFTLTETVKGGVPLKDYQRFVRAAPARSP